jgi:hypothetical protein
MSRWIASCFMIIAALAVATAQPAREKDPIKSEVNEDREWVWTLQENGEIPFGDLLALYSSCRNVLILGDARKIQGTMTFRCPADTELKGDDIDLFVANCLEENRLVLTKAGGNQYRIVPAAEAITSSPAITVAELETAPAWQWITLIYHPANIDENALRGALQNLTSRQGGSVNPVVGGGLLICDRTDRVRELYKVANAFDSAMNSEIKAYETPAGIATDDAIKVLRELFATAQKFRMSPPTITRGAGETTIMVRGTIDLHAEVAEALKVMK